MEPLKGVQKGKTRHPIPVNRCQQGLDGNCRALRRQRKADHLEVFMRLAGASLPSSVVKAQAFEFGHAGPERLEIPDRQELFLVFVVLRDDQQVVINDIELVQERRMGRRDIGNNEVRLRRLERIGLLAPACSGILFLPLLLLPLQAGKHTDNEPHAAVIDVGNTGRIGKERARAKSALGSAHDILPEGPLLQHALTNGTQRPAGSMLS